MMSARWTGVGPGPDHRTTHSIIRETLGKSGNALLRTVTPDQQPAPCGIMSGTRAGNTDLGVKDEKWEGLLS